MELNKSLEEVKDAGVTEETIATAPTVDAASAARPLFDEFYDDWASFDAAIARATAAYHPIRKRSSLTFEVYNRTVSKGKHDRKNIAEFLSKTFKCTHGIKFRSRGSGKRMRHKLRDIGCPFHVYASAVEYGPTYRVKVRTHDKHNHPIGPDSMKMMSGALHESDYELATHDGDNEAPTQQIAESAATNTHVHQIEHVMSSESAAEAAQAAELLDGAIDSTMGEDVFSGSSAAQTTTTDVAVAANTNIQDTTAANIHAPAKFEETMTLESLRKRIADFADERDWNEFHTPRNLLLALNGEVGELCEIFQWKGEVKNTADWSARDKEHLGEEISDVLIYLVRLADKCDVNLPAAVNDKIAKNARKYPADLVRGSSKKYNEYKRMRITEESTL
ncbi:XTP3-transactivated protein [Phytophthora nicotianae]|uniref:dCTP pyrophosphatase 1 n=1 Tax=Phytophthora nicotianae TaxID=4792 RepID=A0A0W8BX95_PHYNI|nr:XTP3-transactivated protein [Phytophthora nicotianae]